MDAGGVLTMQMQPAQPGPPVHQVFQRPNARNFQRRGPQVEVKPADGEAGTGGYVMFDGKRMRKAVHRKTVDYNSAIIQYLENRVWQRDHRDLRAIQPDSLYQIDIPPPMSMLHNSMNCVTTKFIRASTNKFRCPIFCLAWTPEGRRLVTGASSGEFTLWNGLTFNFETILQAHDTSCRAMQWSHNDNWMVTADHSGYIKYWQSNMNNVKMYQGHKEPIRGISFCPSDNKFATCSDDGTVRIWDFNKCHEERILRGHGADVKCVDWHPQKGLLASGSKDNQQPVKLWDPKSGQSLATIHAHKATVMELKWNKNGNWLLTGSRDRLLKLFDIRNMKEEIETFKGHKKEATAVAWHPIHESLFVSGGSDGAVMFWNVGLDREVGSMEEAHEGMVWSLAWHPQGHILASGSNDHSTKFWTRNRPGDRMRDRYNLNTLPGGSEHELAEFDPDATAGPILPGMGQVPVGQIPSTVDDKEEEEDLPTIPGLDWSADESFLKAQEQPKVQVKKIPYARPIPWDFEKAWMTNKLPNLEKFAEKEGKRRRHRDREDRRNRGRDMDRGNEEDNWNEDDFNQDHMLGNDYPEDESMNEGMMGDQDMNFEPGRNMGGNMMNQGGPNMGGNRGRDSMNQRNNQRRGNNNFGTDNQRMMGMGGMNQGPGGMNQGPGGMNNGPGGMNHGPGGMNQGPGGMNQGPGGMNQGPGGMNKGHMNMQQNNGPNIMNQGNMMQGNRGPDGKKRNMDDSDFRNQGNFGGNMNMRGPGNRNMGPNQGGMGQHNNQQRFQGGQFGNDSMQGNMRRGNRNQQGDNFDNKDSKFRGNPDFGGDMDFSNMENNSQSMRGGRGGGRFNNSGPGWNNNNFRQNRRNDGNPQDWGPGDDGDMQDEFMEMDSRCDRNFSGNFGGRGNEGGRGHDGGRGRGDSGRNRGDRGGWNDRRGGMRGGRNDGNFNQNDSPDFKRKRNWNQGPGDNDFSGQRNSGPQNDWSDDQGSRGRGRGRGGGRGNRGFRGGW